MRFLMVILLLVGTSVGARAQAVVTDADTIRVDGVVFRLDGIDTPERDQRCLSETGALWDCGDAARQWLVKHIGSNPVRCEDLGPDSKYPGRRIGRCALKEQEPTINEQLVRQGWAINFEPYARGRFLEHQAKARKARLGLWKGCFVAPRDFRRWNKSTAEVLGGDYPPEKARSARALLFPDDPEMPAGCPIKAKLAKRAWP